MSTLVVNRIKLRIPVEDLLPDIEHEFPPALRALSGFERFSLAKVGPTEMVVVLSWISAEAAAAGAAVLGPGLFNSIIAPHAESQDRVLGPILVEVG